MVLRTECSKILRQGEDEAEVVAAGAEDCVGRIAGGAFAIAAAEMAVGFHVADDGLDGGAGELLGSGKGSAEPAPDAQQAQLAMMALELLGAGIAAHIEACSPGEIPMVKDFGAGAR